MVATCKQSLLAASVRGVRLHQPRQVLASPGSGALPDGLAFSIESETIVGEVEKTKGSRGGSLRTALQQRLATHHFSAL